MLGGLASGGSPPCEYDIAKSATDHRHHSAPKTYWTTLG
jgi:hypothetical protein